MMIVMRAILVLSFFLAATAAVSQDLASLKRPGAVALMRHALAPGTGDPANLILGDCSTQRNLDEIGRAQARRIGEILRDNGIEFDLIWSSEWCRTTETAELMEMGEVQAFPSLNSFFGDRSRGPTQTAATLSALSELPPEARVLLVTHQVNIAALTGVFPRSGEIVVARLSDGELIVEDRILIEP